MGTLLLGCATTPAPSDRVELAQTFADFSRCDATFFRSLHRNEKVWTEYVPVASRGDVAWIQAPDRRSAGPKEVLLTGRPKLAGLSLLAYFDEASSLGAAGDFYDWGFVVEGDVQTVSAALRPLVHDSQRLRKDGPALYARTEVSILGSRWLPVPLSSGTAPGHTRTERVLFFESVEPTPDRPKATRVSCSLQGRVDASQLRGERPDIDPKTYPARLSPTLFEDTLVPREVLANLEAARAAKPLWRPRFKSLRYTVVTEPDRGSRGGGWTTEMYARPDGLLDVRETYSPEFNVQRQLLAGPVQLKSRLNGLSDGRINLTTALHLALPEALTPGAKLKIEAQTQDQPNNGDAPQARPDITCVAGEGYSAAQLWPSIPGRAIPLTCVGGAGSDAVTHTFLEALGVAIQLGDQKQGEEAGRRTLKAFEYEPS